MKIASLFKIRREERWIMWAALTLLLLLNALTVAKYYDIFTPLSNNYWQLFVGRFHVSGFDPISYYVISDWEARYNVYRHPLLSFLMWIPYLLNQGCMAITGINCALFIMAAILVAAGFYAFLFLYRILRDIVGLCRMDSSLLSLLLYSFAFVMLSAMVPDHFILSMFLLLLSLYVSGLLIKERRPMGVGLAIALFVATAGVSLNNGLKVFLSGLFVNGRRFLRPKFVLGAVIVPAMLIWIGARYEYHYLVAPGEIARHAAKAKKKAEEKKRQDSLQLSVAAKKPSAAPKKKRVAKKGAPLMQGEFMRWTDITTPRGASVVENLFGESIQLHPDYLLQDEYRSRPMIVTYRWTINYIVEAAIAALFLVGIWCGRRSRFLWLALSYFGLDLLLHIVLGFGINEVYIMTAHWIYVVPIAIAYLFRTARSRARLALRLLTGLLIAYLYIYNGYFIIDYMLC